MLTIETASRRVAEVRDLPPVSRAGLLLIVAAGIADVIVHLAAGDHAEHHGFSPEDAAHLLGVVGMVLVLAGVVTYGARLHFSRRSGGAAKHGGPDTHAHR